jgi:type IV secretion system protein VirD4
MQALVNTIASEQRLLVTRIKSTGSILKGLAIAIGGSAVLGLFLFIASYRLYNENNQGWWLIWVFEAIPLGYGWHIIALALPGLFRRQFTDAPGTARWATLEDLQKAKVVGKSVDPRHAIYCGMFNGSPVYFDSDRHVITFGATRRGKGVGLLVQALAQLDESFVVLDPSGELAAITLPKRAKKGLVLVLNPADLFSKTHPYLRSCGFSPYVGFSAGDSNFFARSAGLSEPMIPRASIADSFWDEGSVQITTVLNMWEKWREKEIKGHRASMRNVMEMLHYPYAGKGVATLRGTLERINSHHDRQMAKLATRFISDDPDDKQIRGIIATTAGKVKFLNDEILLADMDKHPVIDGKPFDFGMLKDRIITVYIILPDDMLKTHALWLRIVVSSAINALKRRPPGRVRANLLLDEIGHLGYMEPLDTAMGMIAKKDVKAWPVFQSLAQVSRIYGEHGRETFLSGAGVTHSFRADDLETAKYLSERLGRRTEIVTSHNAGSMNVSKTDSAAGFPLMHPDQIMTMGPGELLCWLDRVPHPIKLSAPGYFDQPWIKGMYPNPYYVAKRKRL